MSLIMVLESDGLSQPEFYDSNLVFFTRWYSLGILEKFQHSSALPNIKHNCVVLFLSQQNR